MPFLHGDSENLGHGREYTDLSRGEQAGNFYFPLEVTVSIDKSSGFFNNLFGKMANDNFIEIPVE